MKWRRPEQRNRAILKECGRTKTKKRPSVDVSRREGEEKMKGWCGVDGVEVVAFCC